MTARPTRTDPPRDKRTCGADDLAHLSRLAVMQRTNQRIVHAAHGARREGWCRGFLLGCVFGAAAGSTLVFSWLGV